MGLKEQENELFAEWRNLRPELNIITDGAAEPYAYDRSDLKIIFLLKDPNAHKDEKFDLRDPLRDGKKSKTFDGHHLLAYGNQNSKYRRII